MGHSKSKYRDLIRELNIPGDHARQSQPFSLVQLIFNRHPNIRRVLDLGCGTGNSVDLFRSLDPKIEWTGIDIENSQEVLQRTRTDATFLTYDGIQIPFRDQHFDLIYCNQVLEHVRYPSQLLLEAKRVLKTEGYFIGSTSHLEPYHSNSTWNYTPYGFKCLMDEAGFRIKEIRPGIDGLTLIIRALLGRPKFFGIWWKRESPLNKIIDIAGWILNKNKQEVNFAKLMLCGQFCFIGKTI